MTATLEREQINAPELDEVLTFDYDQRRPAPAAQWLIVDVETVAREDAENFLAPVEAAGNLKDPDKIKASIEERTAERAGKLALDWNLNRIVTITMMADGWLAPQTSICLNEHEEKRALNILWSELTIARRRRFTPLVGFCIKSFDVPVLLQRTRILGMPEPILDYTRYSKEIIDLADNLNFYRGPSEGYSAMSRTLKNFCRVMGIVHDDGDCDGKDVAELVAAGDLEAVQRHCEADVWRVEGLGRRLGVIA